MTSTDFDLNIHDCPADALETESLGHYTGVDEYLRATVDTLVLADGAWLLACLNWVRVRRSLESGGLYRLRAGRGQVFRDRLGPYPSR